jgi:arylsulfatase A-like enzyme
MRRNLSRRGCAILAFVAVSLPLDTQQAHASQTVGKRKPNIVFILVDDMGWTDAACLGSKFYETPNIDRLARSAMRFTSGYAAAPVCSPTRASILTGKYPARLGTTEWFGGGARKGKLLPAPYVNHLPLDETTIAQVLRDAGYRTASIGKWHLGGKGFEPGRFGFDLALAGTERGSPKSYFSPYQNPTLKDGPPGEELTDRLTSEALKFIEANKDRPFFLYLPYFAVHTPLQAKKDLVAKYEARAAKLDKAERFIVQNGVKTRQVHDHAVYAAMVETLDLNVGRILDRLQALGLTDDTVIIFTSDNGGLATSEGWPTSNRPLRVGKGWLYEGGLRVPWLIRWPGQTRPGSVSDHPVISNDFYPTILEIAGLPPRPKQHVDGVSLVPLLKQTGKIADRPLFWHYPHYSNQGGPPSGAVRVGNYTLIEFFEDGKLELYDVVKDVRQDHDLAKQMPELVRKLHQQLRDWRESVKAKMPTPNPGGKSEHAAPASASAALAGATCSVGKPLLRCSEAVPPTSGRSSRRTQTNRSR